MSRALLALLACVHAATPHLTLTDGEYYRMPPVFGLDDYEGCLATGGTYCLGSFELLPSTGQELYSMMQRFSENWVENFNHTRVHRGVCLPRRCRAVAEAGSHQAWFASCVNDTTTADYGLSARLYHLDYCRRRVSGASGGAESGEPAGRPLTANEKAFTGVVATLLALAAVSTGLDLILSDQAKKAHAWALSWSIRGSWSMLAGPPRAGGDSLLQPLDGLRVICMLCVIVEHVCFIATLSFIADTRLYEKMRWSVAGMLLANSTLVVQIFFLMSSFLLAHKLLSERRRGRKAPAVATFRDVMLNRIIRISPNYYFVIWYASSVWRLAGGAEGGADGGPLWQTLVDDEAAVCQRKWWTHLLYLNNVIYPDEKCLIQTWYLAADMQLYAVSLIATLLLGACSGAASGACWRPVKILLGALVGSIAAVFALAYTHSLVPNFIIHNAESVRTGYDGVASFNQIYQSPLGNLPGALAGLLLAHAHHAIMDSDATPKEYRWFRWLAVAGAPLAVLWAALCPLVLAAWPASRAAAAALASLERPVFASLVAFALLGAMHGVEMPWRSWLAWPGWACAARLSFGALLLHMPLNKLLVASRPLPTNLDVTTAMFEWCGVAVLSYLAALPLALLVEFPAQRLYRALTTSSPSPKPATGEKNQTGS